MTSKTIKLIVFLVLLAHGIGHIQGILTGLGVKFQKSSTNISWLLKRLGENTNRLLCSSLFLTAAVLGILTALSFNGWFMIGIGWESLALLCAITSSLSLVLYPNALAMFFNKIGAIAVNIIIFYFILFNGRWPAAVFED